MKLIQPVVGKTKGSPGTHGWLSLVHMARALTNLTETHGVLKRAARDDAAESGDAVRHTTITWGMGELNEGGETVVLMLFPVSPRWRGLMWPLKLAAATVIWDGIGLFHVDVIALVIRFTACYNWLSVVKCRRQLYIFLFTHFNYCYIIIVVLIWVGNKYISENNYESIGY